MKQLFICIVLLACSVILSAQQRPQPSFRDFLNNNKSLPLSDPHLFNSPGKSSMHIDAGANGNRLKIDPLKKYVDKEDASSSLFPGTFAGVLPNGNKLYLLPQDNMPCVVPDLSQFNMPVAKGNNELDKKINASIP